jgi:uncharacterized damage-inducible protein DinB
LNSYLHELFAHQEWADAEHWRAFEAHPPALEDKAIRERLLHIHMVQHFFLSVVGPHKSDFAIKKAEDFANMAGMKQYAIQFHNAARELLPALTAAQMEELVEPPWFNPPLKLSRRHALTQAAMHSHYHRGQNATRLRELGGAPPMTDFIIWLREGRPAARWE